MTQARERTGKYRNPKKRASKKQEAAPPTRTLQKKPLLRKANGDSAAPAAVSDYRKPKAAALPMGDDTSFMHNLLDNLDAAPAAAPTRPSLASRKRKSSPDFDPAAIEFSSRPRAAGGRVGYASSSSFGSDPLFDDTSTFGGAGGETSGSDPLDYEDARVVAHSAAARGGKKHKVSGVEEPMAGLDVHMGATLDAGLGDSMDVDDDDDLVVGDRKPTVGKPAARAPNRARALVNAAAVRTAPAGAVKPDPSVEDDAKLPPPAAAKAKGAKYRGVDWRVAMQSLADEVKPFPEGISTTTDDEKSEGTGATTGDESESQDFLANMPRKVSAAQARKLAIAQAEKELPAPMVVTAFEDAKPNGAAAKDAAEGEGQRLKFFWLDQHEVNGVVHLFGKVWDRQQQGKAGVVSSGMPGQGPGKWVSCCVTIRGIERNLFFLPRESYTDGQRASASIRSSG